MLVRYRSIIGRIGVILVAIGLFLILRRLLKFHGTLSKLFGSTMLTYLGIGLLVVGSILVVVFVYSFLLSERKPK